MPAQIIWNGGEQSQREEALKRPPILANPNCLTMATNFFYFCCWYKLDNFIGEGKIAGV